MLLFASLQLANAAVALRRPALQMYSWVHTALRGLVTRQQTLTASLHDFIQAYKQKNMAEVSPHYLMSASFTGIHCPQMV